MLDEFYTSKQCPCGTSERQEDNANIQDYINCRPRCHKTVGLDGPCCVECSLGKEKMDRDVLAINFLLCVVAALRVMHVLLTFADHGKQLHRRFVKLY